MKRLIFCLTVVCFPLSTSMCARHDPAVTTADIDGDEDAPLARDYPVLAEAGVRGRMWLEPGHLVSGYGARTLRVVIDSIYDPNSTAAALEALHDLAPYVRIHGLDGTLIGAHTSEVPPVDCGAQAAQRAGRGEKGEFGGRPAEFEVLPEVCRDRRLNLPYLRIVPDSPLVGQWYELRVNARIDGLTVLNAAPDEPGIMRSIFALGSDPIITNIRLCAGAAGETSSLIITFSEEVRHEDLRDGVVASVNSVSCTFLAIGDSGVTSSAYYECPEEIAAHAEIRIVDTVEASAGGTLRIPGNYLELRPESEGVEAGVSCVDFATEKRYFP